jgi:hypothetical protein
MDHVHSAHRRGSENELLYGKLSERELKGHIGGGCSQPQRDPELARSLNHKEFYGKAQPLLRAAEIVKTHSISFAQRSAAAGVGRRTRLLFNKSDAQPL